MTAAKRTDPSFVAGGIGTLARSAYFSGHVAAGADVLTIDGTAHCDESVELNITAMGVCCATHTRFRHCSGQTYTRDRLTSGRYSQPYSCHWQWFWVGSAS